MIKITLTRGLVAKTKEQRRVVTALGLGKFGSSVVHHDSPTILGMVNKVHHLVTVEAADEKAAKSKSNKAEKKAPKKAEAK